MDGRDCATCQNLSRRDIDGIFGILNDNKDEIGNSDHLLPLLKGQKHEGGGESDAES